ncbi:MAG: DUF4214 domain-containing protein [Pirellulales bacterium]
MLATVFTVDSLADESDGDFSAGDFTLREAIEQANLTADADTVQFASRLSGSIELSRGQMEISNPLTIAGPGAEQLTIDAQAKSRLFHVTATSGTVEIDGLTLTGGQATFGGAIFSNFGGAIFSNFGATLRIENSLLVGNQSSRGGAVAVAGGGGDLLIFSSSFIGNTSVNDSGAVDYRANNGSMTVVDSTFADNQAAQFGGAMVIANNSFVTLQITQSTISGNRSGDDGGGLNFNSPAGAATIRNSTIADNVSDLNNDNGGVGGGIQLVAGDVTLVSTIVADNADSTGPNDIHRAFGALDVSNSLLENIPAGTINGTDSGNITEQDPRLAPLADYGGGVLTHALGPDSPAIDAGDNPLSLLNDQRGSGFPREVGASVDIGAYEVDGLTFDFGDAPDPVAGVDGRYPTLLENDGPWHVIGSGLSLGATVDAEADGQPSPDALGDDGAGADDEDGVTGDFALAREQSAELTVTASAPGLLNAWIDFNADGDWDDVGEQIATDLLLSAGGNPLNFDVPADAAFGDTFARFRLSTAGGLSPRGAAPDGEVEDYLFTIVANVAPQAVADRFLVGSGAAVNSTGSVLSNDSDADGDALAAQEATQTQFGTLSLLADGSFTYAPGTGFWGFDSFSYQADDGVATSDATPVVLLSHTAALVEKLYLQILGRGVEPSGWEFWSRRIDSGEASLGNVAAGIFLSAERLDPIVSQFYRDFLLREPEQEGLVFWRTRWQVEGEPDNVIAGMISSPEFFASAGGTNRLWVTEMYRRLLNREPDQQGLDFWTDHLDNGRLGREQVVLGFVKSDENFRNLVTDWFQQYLNRQPTSDAEIAPFVSQLQQGASQRDIQTQILDTDEYFNSPPVPADGTAVRV